MVYNFRYNTRKASRESSWSQLCPQDFKIKDRILVDLGKIENRKRDGFLNVHTHSYFPNINFSLQAKSFEISFLYFRNQLVFS